MDINPQHLRIATYRTAGRGGWTTRTDRLGVKITHIPTGLSASCEGERSIYINKAEALIQLEKLLERHSGVSLCKQAFDSTYREGEADYAVWEAAWNAALNPDKVVLHVPV